MSRYIAMCSYTMKRKRSSEERDRFVQLHASNDGEGGVLRIRRMKKQREKNRSNEDLPRRELRRFFPRSKDAAIQERQEEENQRENGAKEENEEREKKNKKER